VIVWLGVPETLPARAKGHQERHKQGNLRATLSDPLLWIYSLLALFFNCLYAQWSVAMPLDMQAHGLNETLYGFVSAANAVQVVIIGLPVTAFFARISQNRALAVASLMLGLGLGLYSWMHSLVGYEIGVLIWTCGEIIYYPLSTALIASISPSHLRGVYQGIFGTMTGVSYLIAPALGGAIMQYLGAAALWRTCLVTGLFIACAYLALLRRAFPHVPAQLAHRCSRRKVYVVQGVADRWHANVGIAIAEAVWIELACPTALPGRGHPEVSLLELMLHHST
jgi:MFS family permease